MKKAGVAKLKARLSHYLRMVRRGETVTILDRDTPVAQLVPIKEPTLQVREPVPGSLPLNQIPLPPPLKLDLDIVDLLMEERQNHR